MKFSTFHAFMLGDVKGVAGDHLLEGQRIGGTHHSAIADELALIRAADELALTPAGFASTTSPTTGFSPTRWRWWPPSLASPNGSGSAPP